MKKIFQLSIIISAATLVFSSCEKKIEEAYPVPNSFLRVPVEQLLQPASYYMALDQQTDDRFLGGYIQNWTNISALNQWDRQGYQAGSDNGGAIWRMHYYDLGQNMVKMVEWGTEEQKWDYVGVGKTIQAWSWLLLTDYHGEVILKESFNTNLLTFKYDTQEDVYLYVRTLCREAIANLSRTDGAVSAVNLAKGDAFLNGGDVEKWKKFAYGVMARTFNHLTNKASYQADSVIFYCDKAMQTTADDATIKFANSGLNNEANFLGPFRGNMAAYRQTDFIVNLLTGANPAITANDPRQWYYLQQDANNTAFKGLQIAKGETVIPSGNRPRNFWGNTSALSIPPNDLNSKYIFRNNAEFPIMTATEIHFMKAEAAFRKGDKPTALASYKRGIEESFNMLTTRFNQNVPPANMINGANMAAYMSNTSVVPPAAIDLKLTQIMLQKYIALWGYGMQETWVDLRRYHYDKDIDAATTFPVYRGFTLPSGTDLFPDNGGKPAYRVRPRYNSEYIWNVVALDLIGARTADYHTVECWFSKP
jgi:Starch-binding associating with outer membrane